MNYGIIEEYDRLAERFARWIPSQQFQEIFEQTVLGTLGDHKGEVVTIIDAGCGHGTWLKRVLDYCDSRQLQVRAIGIDLSGRRIELARREFETRTDVCLICEDLERVTLPVGVDIIFSSEVFLHFSPSQQHLLLRRWAHLTKPGGSVIIIDKDRYSWHSLKLGLQTLSGAVGRRLWGKYRLFDEEGAPLYTKFRYPCFHYLVKVGTELGLQAHPLIKIKEFTALKLVKP